MFIVLVLREICLLVPHHLLALLAFVIILLHCGLAAIAAVTPSASAAIVCDVFGEVSHQGFLGRYRLRHLLHGGFHLVDPAAAALAAAT